MSYQAGTLVEVTTGDVANGGWCVARPDSGPVLFVRHALPGERVLVKITEVTSRFARADAVSILAASPDRVAPPCPHARPGGCGGCDWQHASLPAQRALKATVISQQLRRLAGLDREVTVEPLPDREPRNPGLGWRTRVRFAVGADGVAGLRAHRSHEVVDVGECPIAHPAINELGITKERWSGVSSIEAVVGYVTSADTEPTAWISTNARQFSNTRQVPNAHQILNGHPSYQRTTVAVTAGNHSQAGGLGGVVSTPQKTWRVSAGAFWQVHPGAADALAEAVLAVLEPRAGDTALDLYCGAGLFAGVLAPLTGPGGAVIGVESDAAAVRDARHNLKEHPWAQVHRGDVAAVLLRGRLPRARLVVADPPRAGLAREVIAHLDGSGAERFAYVSCDPATLARDIALLLARGWSLTGLRAFDAFPMTHHVECVASLVKGSHG